MSNASHCIEPVYDVNVSREEIFDLCRRHHILPQHYRCFWRIVARGEIKSDDFGRRIIYQSNYRQVTDKILEIVDTEV